jgi:biotin carboxyl carrier protein
MAAIISSMPGRVIEIKVKIGDEVKKGQELCVIEAMKMQMPVNSTQNGKVVDIRMEIGQGIKKGDVLMELE